MTGDRDRDALKRPRQARPRDALGRPLPYGSAGVEPVSEEPLPPAKTLVLARTLVEGGRPFAAHEVLEARWKAGPDEERHLWQGLAQICVALTHAARGNTVGALRLFEPPIRSRAVGRALNGVTERLNADSIPSASGQPDWSEAKVQSALKGLTAKGEYKG